MSLNAKASLDDLFKDFWDSLAKKDQDIVLDAFFVLDFASKGQKTPREMQLRATIAIMNGNDLVARAGTGYGKTMAMIILALLNRDFVTITISPHRLIQKNHVCILAA